MSLQDALQKVTALPGVQAAFVFDQYLRIAARQVPTDYGDDVLQRIAQQLLELASASWQAGVRTQEFRLVYERVALYVRLVGVSHYLVIFMAPDLETLEFRQPVNLAVLVLEKTLRPDTVRLPAGKKTDNLPAFSQMAVHAERVMREAIDHDESFAGKLRLLCYNLMGQPARELVDNGMEEEMLSPPLVGENDMRRLMEYVIMRIPHPILRRIIIQDAEDLMRVALKEK